MTEDAFADVPERELRARANQLKAYATQAAGLAVALAVQSGRLMALASVREADQPDGALR